MPKIALIVALLALTACAPMHHKPGVTSQRIDIQALLKSRYPAARIYMADGTYQIPTKAEVLKFLQQYQDRQQPISQLFDCDDRALKLKAAVAQYQYWRGDKLPWAFGEAWAPTHAYCIVVTDRGIMLINPTRKETSAASSHDGIWFIRM